MAYEKVDLGRIEIRPLHRRRSKYGIDDILLDPDSPPRDPGPLAAKIGLVAERIRSARECGASVVLAFGAHLVKNGLGPIVTRMAEAGWITHLATNGAAAIHDWEYAFQGRSEEDVRANVARGCFGTWDETGRYIHLAVLAGAVHGMGYGESLGKLIREDGCHIPGRGELAAALQAWSRDPSDDPLAPARAELLQALVRFDLPPVFSGSLTSTRTFRSPPAPTACACHSPSIRASVTISSPTIPCSTAPSSGALPIPITASSSRAWAGWMAASFSRWARR